MAPITFFSPQDAKKGGAGIEDLPAIMSNSIDTTLKHLSNLSIVTADKGEHTPKIWTYSQRLLSKNVH